ncbi:hypothetical protein AB0A63_00980 [Lentzea sp. NPDC042327]|uniref:hypothetical protein n=1 Tax=Lentzea sp. NPDC042327 TaxID=3154801 RepID=UPI0033EB5097
MITLHDRQFPVRVRKFAVLDGSAVATTQGADGRPCGAHRAGSQPYFTWHRTTVFRG